MARGFATSLFHFCTRKRTLSTLKALLLSHSHTSSSQFHTLHDSLRPFSTRLLNPRFHPNFSQSSNLSGGRVHSPRPFSTAGDGDEKGNGVAEPEYESDVDFGKNVRFKFGNEIKDAIYALSKNGIVENEGNNECNLKIVDSIESSSRDEPEKKSEQCVHVASHDPVELYRDLCSAEKGAKLHRSEMEEFKEVCNFFTISGWASNQALAIYIGLSFFPIAAHTFWGFISEKCPADVAKYLVSLGPCDAAVKFLFPIFVEFCLENFRDETERFRVMVESADLTKPHTWFPIARAMKRKIIYHCGPTNSGKTYNALQRFIEAKKGIYCSPLRLLAMDS